MVPSTRESCVIQLRNRPAYRPADHKLTAVTNRGRLSAPGDLTKPGSLDGGPGSLQGSGAPDIGRPSGSGAAGAAVRAPEPAEVYLAGDGIPAGEPLSDYARQHDLQPASARPRAQVPAEPLAAAAVHHRLRHREQRGDVQRGAPGPALAGADPAAE